MTTRRSSSPAGSPKTSGMLIEVVDSSGQTLVLDQLLGKGGEGSVFVVHDQPALAGKIYHQTPLTPDLVAKLEAMVNCRTNKLEAISAWPQSLLYTPHRKEPCGILIPCIGAASHMHELYGTSNRRKHFPHARWQHLVLAARNTAAAFDTMHEAGIVVGDVNQGNLLVDETMRVRFIDCDSFQIAAGDQSFLCPVGTPHFTPPELQGKKLRETPRSPDHDLFGLAVLLFHLMFVGRHPFAGRCLLDGEQTIERAILERRFAFSKNKAATQMEPPPASLRLEDYPAEIGELFERAFRQPDGVTNRPTAREWVAQLDALLASRKNCTIDEAHVFYNRLDQCPWCRIEDEGGPAFFVVLDGSVSMVSPDRLTHLEAKLHKLTIPNFTSLSPDKLKIPQALPPKRLKSLGRMGGPDAAALGLVASTLACLAAPASVWALAAGAVGALASGAYLLFSKPGRSRRTQLDELGKRLVQEQGKLHKRAGAIAAAHRQRERAYQDSVDAIKAQAKHYYAADNQLQDVLVVYREMQLNRFLASKLIQEHISQIPGMSPSRASVLQSYGIESALDVDQMKLLGVPMLHPNLLLELTSWRERVERQFVFKPEHGVNFQQGGTANKDAVMRFKVAEARRILMASKQLDALAHGSRDQVERELAHFDRAAEATRETAKQLRDWQSNRRPAERLINQSPVAVISAALGGPLFGLLLYWMFG
jgi:DNA-binding helix-hairpin-helix protein with protein kinase domain